MYRVRYLTLVGLFSSCFWGGALMQAAGSQNYLEQQADSVILFRFVPKKLMFYSPFAGNDKAIAEAAKLIEQHKSLIREGKAWIVIRGFCGSYPSRTENLRVAKNRSNQVKSYFITHHGMKEDYYRTINTDKSYQGSKDVVALIGLEYSDVYKEALEQVVQARRDSLDRLRADSLAALELKRAEALRQERLRADSLATSVTSESEKSENAKKPERVYVPTPWYIKSNLIYDAILMPSLEIEYRINERWSAAMEGNIAWWHNNGKHKYYQLATILPEVRYWFKPQGIRRGHYAGLFGGGGWYDLENGGKGYKGEGGMVGISYGYMFPIGKYFAFEAGVGVGFMTTKYDEYLPLDGHYVYQQSSRTNYFGPLKLRFAFVWNIGRSAEKGGRK